MGLKRFYVKEHHILTKHPQNWLHVKTLLDTPIWNNAESKWAKENVRLGNLKVENLTEEDPSDEIDRVRITYGTLLKAFGDLIVETDKEVHSISAIRNKFEKISIKNYEKLKKSIPEEDHKLAYGSKLKDVEKTKNKHLKLYREIFGKKGLNVSSAVNFINSWLNKATNNSAVFIKKVGEDYKLLIYYARDKKGRIEYFCSDENKVEFAKFINERRLKIKNLKDKFENIQGLEKIENVLSSSTNKRKFFPEGGPFFQNFDNNWIFRRPEVGEIIKEITKNVNKVQLLTGRSASGKTVIARNVGLELKESGWRIYYISGSYLKNQVTNILDRFNYLNAVSNRILVIIEDVHKEPLQAALLVRRLTSN
ncbi:MAG: hypothetical protein ACOC5T_07205, partial [Elusimicrobiota bacterium]